MLTIFSTPKPFRGHIEVIQRNAIQSWMRVHPDVEIILFGDEEGAGETAREFGLRHEPEVAKNEFGTKLLRGFFEPAQQMARHDVLCYVNCDIVLLPGFAGAIERVESRFEQFLMVGQRTDVDITERWDFAAKDWDQRLKELAHAKGTLVPRWSIDYFAFRRGLYQAMPPFVIGRVWWDHWLVWKASSLQAPVIDATQAVCAVHQNHDYSYHVKGASGVWNDEQAARNLKLAGGKKHLYTIEDATHELDVNGHVRRIPLRRAGHEVRQFAWDLFVRRTINLRNALKLRRKFWQANRAGAQGPTK